MFEGKISSLKGRRKEGKKIGRGRKKGRKEKNGSAAAYVLIDMKENALGRAGWGKLHLNT